MVDKKLLKTKELIIALWYRLLQDGHELTRHPEIKMPNMIIIRSDSNFHRINWKTSET